jgi:hypothetical protein
MDGSGGRRSCGDRDFWDHAAAETAWRPGFPSSHIPAPEHRYGALWTRRPKRRLFRKRTLRVWRIVSDTPQQPRIEAAGIQAHQSGVRFPRRRVGVADVRTRIGIRPESFAGTAEWRRAAHRRQGHLWRGLGAGRKQHGRHSGWSSPVHSGVPAGKSRLPGFRMALRRASVSLWTRSRVHGASRARTMRAA